MLYVDNYVLLLASFEAWCLAVSQVGGCSQPYPRMFVELDLILLVLKPVLSPSREFWRAPSNLTKLGKFSY